MSHSLNLSVSSVPKAIMIWIVTIWDLETQPVPAAVGAMRCSRVYPICTDASSISSHCTCLLPSPPTSLVLWPAFFLLRIAPVGDPCVCPKLSCLRLHRASESPGNTYIHQNLVSPEGMICVWPENLYFYCCVGTLLSEPLQVGTLGGDL